jgi:hypothetical protein
VSGEGTPVEILKQKEVKKEKGRKLGMKKEDKVSRLKKRKRRREKRQRWRKREMKRREKLMEMQGISVGSELPPSAADLRRMNEVAAREAAEEMFGEAERRFAAHPEPACLGIGMGMQDEHIKLWADALAKSYSACAGERMPNWWTGLPKILRAVTRPAVWLHVRYLKWKYPLTYIKSDKE